MLKLSKKTFALLSKTSACALLVFALLPSSPATLAQESTNKMVRVVTKRQGDRTRFFVENLEASEVTATFDLKLTNLRASAGSFTATYPPNCMTEAFTLAPVDADKQWSYSYVNHFTMGSLSAVHDDSVIYVLPYAPGTENKVTQGYNGSYSHSGADQFAIDFKMPPGTPVHAARSGVVVKTKTDSNVGGPDRKYENCANYILIRHTDGTVANYAHLMKDGCAAKVGQIVQAGDLIGYSGNTGFTSGPHLHFSVFKTKSGKQRVSIPVKFQTASAKAITITEGKTYKCVVTPRAVARAVAPAPSDAANVNPVSTEKPARAPEAADVKVSVVKS